MITLKIGNSTSTLEGLSITQLKELRNLMSYTVDKQASYFSKSYGRDKRHLMSKRGEFPSGLLGIAEKYLSTVPHTVVDTRVVPTPTPGMFKPTWKHSPYPEQELAAEACVKQGRGTVSAVTGSGKSLMMALTIAKLNVRTLIIVPTLNLKTQLRQNLKEIFGTLKNIAVENIDSPALKTATDYDCLILDEAHHSGARTYRELSRKCWNKIYWRFFYTATPFRSRDEEQILFESIAGQVIYRLDYQTAVAKKYVCPVECYYYDLPKVKVKGTTWAQVYSELVVNNKPRNELIYDLMANLFREGLSTLCLVKEIKHGNNLATDLFAFANGTDEMTGAYIEAFNNREIKVMVGTNGCVSEGIDTRPCEFVLIAGLGKSRNQIIQSVGRGLRNYPGKKSCKVILFNDVSHKFTKNHFKAQCKVMEEIFGVTPVRLIA